MAVRHNSTELCRDNICKSAHNGMERERDQERKERWQKLNKAKKSKLKMEM